MYKDNMAIKVAGLHDRPVLEMVLFKLKRADFIMPSNCSLLRKTVSFETDCQNILWADIKMTWSNIGKILLPYQ